MAFKTLSEIRTLVRQKADIENDGNHTTDTEIDVYINDAIATLTSLLVDGTDGTLFTKNAGVLHKLGDNSYQLPSDFSQLIDVSVNVQGHYIRSVEADPQAYAQLTSATYNGRAFTRHFLRWNREQGRGELFIFPEPTSTDDIAVQYIAETESLSLGTDTLNFPSFWYQWVVFDAAIQCANKEDSNPTALMQERQKVEKRVRDHIRSMTPTQVKSIRRTGDRTRSRFYLPRVW